MNGVLQQERERQQVWADLGLPDPVKIEAEERATERLTGAPFRSPKRAQLDSYFQTHPADRPSWW